jgi:ribonuclease P protein component
MLKKQNRVTKKLFPLTKKNKLVVEEGFFLLRITFLKEGETSKASVIVSKKKIKKSSERNYIKRRIYSILYDILEQKPTGFIFLIFPEKNIQNISYQELQTKIRNTILQKN